MIFSILQNASATFRISGPDANTFLNGQFTQELRGNPGISAYGLWLNQKGRVLADSQILRWGADEHLVFSQFGQPAAIRQRLEDYLIADDVSLEDQSALWSAVLLHGADQAVAALFGEVPLEGRWVRTSGTYAFPAFGQSAEWTWLLCPASEAHLWRAKLAHYGRQADNVEIARARILAGIPAVPADIGPDDLPNEGGLDATAISYTKGCYLGQEVMSRLKNLGQVRRKLHVVRGAGAPPAPRTALVQNGKRVGETRSAASDGVQGFVAFAMISLVNFDTARPLHLGEDGAPLEVLRHG